MTEPTDAEILELASRLRNACTSVRSKSYPLADLIPLMQQAADALESATAQPVAEASRFGSPELQAMIIALCVEKDQADSVLYDPKAVLDVFNSACAGSEKPVGYLRGILAVIAHWESRPEPHRWMVPAPADSELEDAARWMFDAGWKAAARFCDRDDVVADGIIGFGACPQFMAAFKAARAAQK